MSLLCPNCRAAVDTTTLACPGGHQFVYDDGVLVLLETQFAARLCAFSAVLTRFRDAEHKRLTDPAAYEQLPYGKARENVEWRARCYDLALIKREIAERGRLRILDVGASNGWLSHQLALQGHELTAVEQFTDEYDGLRAKKFYSSDWRAIQLDLTDLSVLNQRYDVVILNHGLHFLPDPVAGVADAQRRVAEGGLLIAIGLAFFRDPSARIRHVAALQQAHRERYNAEFFLRPTRGYLDTADKKHLEAQGLQLRLNPFFWRANLKSLARSTAPRHYYGVARG